MNIEDIQTWVNSLLNASAALTAAGVVKLMDDGSAKREEREAGLKAHGLVITTWEIDAHGLVDSSKAGGAVQTIYVPILVEENVKVNRAAGGTGMVALAAVRHVQAACKGKRSAPASPFVLLPMEPPFKNFGRINGVNQIVVNFAINSML